MSVAVSTERITLELGALTSELHQFLGKLYSSPRAGQSDSAWLESMRTRCRELSERAAEARKEAVELWDEFGEKWPKTARAAERLCSSLDRMSSSLSSLAGEMADSSLWPEWRSWGQRLSVNYEDLLRSVRSMKLPEASKIISLPHFKPRNISRNMFHIGNGLLGLVMSLWVLDRLGCIIVMLIFSAVVGFCEITRALSPRFNRMITGLPVFKQTIRPREMNRVNSASVFAWTLTGVCILTPMAAVQVGLLVLTFADPAASLVGKRWGKVKLWKQKSVIGSLAFFAVAATLSSLGMAILGGLSRSS